MVLSVNFIWKWPETTELQEILSQSSELQSLTIKMTSEDQDPIFSETMLLNSPLSEAPQEPVKRDTEKSSRPIDPTPSSNDYVYEPI